MKPSPPSPVVVQDSTLIDAYSLAHFGFGYIAKKLGYSTSQIMVVSLLYEVIEDPLIEGLKLKRWKKETKKNALMDVLFAYLGSRVAS